MKYIISNILSEIRSRGSDRNTVRRCEAVVHLGAAPGRTGVPRRARCLPGSGALRCRARTRIGSLHADHVGTPRRRRLGDHGHQAVHHEHAVRRRFMVFARTDPDAAPSRGISACLVERGLPGLSVGPKDCKMGQAGRSRPTSPSTRYGCWGSGWWTRDSGRHVRQRNHDRRNRLARGHLVGT
jgi:hypothetical protein